MNPGAAGIGSLRFALFTARQILLAGCIKGIGKTIGVIWQKLHVQAPARIAL